VCLADATGDWSDVVSPFFSFGWSTSSGLLHPRFQHTTALALVVRHLQPPTLHLLLVSSFLVTAHRRTASILYPSDPRNRAAPPLPRDLVPQPERRVSTLRSHSTPFNPAIAPTTADASPTLFSLLRTLEHTSPRRCLQVSALCLPPSRAIPTRARFPAPQPASTTASLLLTLLPISPVQQPEPHRELAISPSLLLTSSPSSRSTRTHRSDLDC
jgi:hypothetical protein